MSEELTVEQALKELREMFPSPTRYQYLRVSVRGISEGKQGYLYTAKAHVGGIAFYRDGDSATQALSECMAQVRKWKESQS